MPSIGHQLASARRKQGLNIKEIEENTKIRSRFLKAIEKNEFDVLPGPVYVKGFIRSYANYLKIEADPLVEEYKKIQPKQNLSVAELMPPSFKVATGSKKIPKITIPFALITLIFFMMVFLAYLGYQDTTLSNKISSKKEIDQEIESLKESRKPKKKKSDKKTVKKTTLFRLRLVFERGTWVRLRADGKTFFYNYVRKGESRTFISRKPIEITAGRGSFVKVYKDNHQKGTLSTNPTIATKVFKK
ncbi:MAG: helix-turn-helix domain-containing protein [Actinobacteria bacterium]|nr:MAG: helix-turn-helix domain-containing protein [Actinomycetota bacterium]